METEQIKDTTQTEEVTVPKGDGSHPEPNNDPAPEVENKLKRIKLGLDYEHMSPEQKAKYDAMSPGDRQLAEEMAMDAGFVVTNSVMKLRNEMASIKAERDRAMNKLKTMCPDDRYSILEARVMETDIEALAKLDMKKEEDWQKVLDIYTMEDGGVISFSLDIPETDIKYREMHRDYIIYVNSVNTETAKYNAVEAKVTAEIEEIFKEYAELVGEEEAAKARNVSYTAQYYRMFIEKLLSREDLNTDLKEKLLEYKEADHDGRTLRPIIEEIEKLLKKRNGDASSIIYGFRNNFIAVANAAKRALDAKFKKYNYSFALENLHDFEKRAFPGEFDDYNNVFIFLLMRYIKANYEKFDNKNMYTIGEIFANMGFLLRPVEERPDTVVEFEQSVRKLLGLVIKK